MQWSLTHQKKNFFCCSYKQATHVQDPIHTFKPSAIRPWARMIDVVEPSPARSFVLAPACLTSLTPTFSKGSSNSI